MAQSLKVILSPNAKSGEVLCTSNFPGHRSERRESRQIRVCSWADKTDLSGDGASSLCLTDAVDLEWLKVMRKTLRSHSPAPSALAQLRAGAKANTVNWRAIKALSHPLESLKWPHTNSRGHKVFLVGFSLLSMF